MKQLPFCMKCGKKFRSDDQNAKTLFSGSLSGNSCITHLCGNCGGNDRILNQMQKVNDLKLQLMDGEISLETYKQKLIGIKTEGVT
jgi:hypothetical protein